MTLRTELNGPPPPSPCASQQDIFAVAVSLITGRIVYISDQAASILNCKREVFQNAKFVEFLSPQDVSVFHSFTTPYRLPSWSMCTGAGRHTHTHAHTYVRACTHGRTHTHTRALHRSHTRSHVHMQTNARMHTQSHTHAHVHKQYMRSHTYTYTYTYIHTRARTHIHIHIPIRHTTKHQQISFHSLYNVHQFVLIFLKRYPLH